jgi:2-polyprenyl-6-methoxyphenol hydroxylase-like FAD-dependent oxidoreductase
VPLLVAATDYRESYLADVTTMTPLARIARGPVVLVGDAAHPLPTLLGEGANTALEDATGLAEEVAADPDDLPGAFERFDRRRRPRLARLHEEGQRAVRRFLESTPTRSTPP